MPPRSGSTSTSSALAKFAAGGLVALAIVGVASFFVMRHIGTSEATDNAKEVTRIVGREIVQPKISPGLLRGRPEAIHRLDQVMQDDVLRGSIVRVKIWTGDGRIVYSDEHRLIGSHYSLGADDLEALRSEGVAADLSDLSKPENRFERSYGKLLQVYLGISGPHGKPLLFEAYQPFSSVASSGSDIWRSFAPALVGALIALALIQVPLALGMARRLRREHAEREALLHRAIEASDRERRRIAADIHDGLVQRLAGTSFSLAAAAEHGDNGAGEALRAGAAQTRQSVRELRTLLVDIYPPNVRTAGLEAALTDLLSPLHEAGIDTRLDFTAGADDAVDPEQKQVVFRIAQEALRNVKRHAEAKKVRVSVDRQSGGVKLTVEDDGHGLPETGEGPISPQGHFGLQLMHDLAADAGGVLTLGAGPLGGTQVRLEIPPR
jgi:signal transduction histidine kinase